MLSTISAIKTAAKMAASQGVSKADRMVLCDMSTDKDQEKVETVVPIFD